MADNSRFSISQFKSTIDAAGGLSRGVFYDCQITLNASLESPGATASTGIPTFSTGTTGFGYEQLLLCKAANLPASQIDFTELKYFTRSVKVPATSQFSPITLTFYNTQNYQLRNKFLAWMSRFNQPLTNSRDTTGLYGKITLQPKNMLHKNVAIYKFLEVFPTSIAGLQYSYENDTQVQTYDVEFQYLTATFNLDE